MSFYQFNQETVFSAGKSLGGRGEESFQRDGLLVCGVL